MWCGLPSRSCLLVCVDVALLGEVRTLALDESLPVLSVRMGNGVPRSEADLAR